MLNANLSMLKEGEHYNKDDLKPAIKERMLLKNPDPEESNTQASKAQLAQMPLSYAAKRDAMIDYMNPRQELSKFTKTVDEIPPFDQGPVSLLRPYDYLARQQVNMVISGRSNYVLEESKYSMNIETQEDKQRAAAGQMLVPGRGPPIPIIGSGGGSSGPPSGPKQQTVSQSGMAGQEDPGPTPQMKAELRRASFMETTQAL